jgi:hypothetical protein
MHAFYAQLWRARAWFRRPGTVFSSLRRAFSHGWRDVTWVSQWTRGNGAGSSSSFFGFPPPVIPPTSPTDHAAHYHIIGPQIGGFTCDPAHGKAHSNEGLESRSSWRSGVQIVCVAIPMKGIKYSSDHKAGNFPNTSGYSEARIKAVLNT